MAVQLRKWFSSPIYEDDIRAGRARLLHYTTLTVLIMAVTAPPLVYLFLNVQFPVQLLFGRLIPMVLLMLVARLLLVRGHVEIGGIVLVVFTWLVLAVNVLTSSGLFAPSYFGFFLVVLLAGFLVGGRAALITAGASIIFGTILLLVQQANPDMYTPPTLATTNWVTGTAGFLIFGAVLYLVVRDYSQAVFKIRASNEALQEAQTRLEERVTTRTRDLAIAAEIGQAIAQTRDLDRLLADGVDLIWKGFDLYHAQIYLMDNAERNLVIRAGSGEAGRRLVAQKHTIPLASNSINTAAARQKQPVLVSDTRESPLYRPNPFLPDTRAELAVPLIIEDKVVGVLNVQCSNPYGLTEIDVPAHETLAGQLTIAIENARLFTELTHSQKALEQQAQRMTQSGWQEFLDGIFQPETIALTYAGGTIQESGRGEKAFFRGASPPAHNEPISVSGLTIGAIQVETDHEKSLTADEEALIAAVAGRVGQQVENLRLLGLAETYQRAAEEAVRRLTREAWTEQLAGQAAGFHFDGNRVREWPANIHTPPAGFVVPLSIRDETVGEVALGNVFNRSAAAELTAAVVERLSAHIENLRLAEQRESALRQTELRSEELAAINRVAQAVSRQLELSQLLETIHESISQVMQVEAFIVGTYDAQAHKMLYPYIYDSGRRYDVVTMEPGPASQGYQVIQSGTPLLNLHTPEEVAALEVEKENSQVTIGSESIPASTIFVPLTIGENTIGTMSVQSYAYNAYTEQDVALLAGMANHVAVALDNARLFNAAQRRAERERLVNEISQKILDTNTVEAALQTTIHELGRAFRARHTRVELGPPAGEPIVESHPENGQQPHTEPVNGAAVRS